MKDNFAKALTSEHIIYDLLMDVFSSSSYSTIALNDALKSTPDPQSRAYITKVFYGVIEKSVQFDFIINKLCDKKPKNNIVVLLKMGLFLLRYMSVPSYAAINKIVNLTKSLGKAGVAGFVNATLRKSGDFELKCAVFDTFAQRVSVLYSYPLWLVELLIRENGQAWTEQFLSYERKQKTHIRPNLFAISKADFDLKLNEVAASLAQRDVQAYVEPSPLGYYVKHEIMSSLADNLFTPQSYASMLAVHAYLNKGEIDTFGHKKVLDVCAAPGGKAVYLNERFPMLDITACDIHPHRLKLISDYASRLGARITTRLNDGCVYFEPWDSSFDLVICDVPCSGLGLVNSKPDIVLNKSLKDIASLSQVQYKILKTSAKYVKSGGILCYSTCTITKKENEEVVAGFLKNNPNFKQIPIKIDDLKIECDCLKLLPQTHDCDAFFIAKLLKQ